MNDPHKQSVLIKHCSLVLALLGAAFAMAACGASSPTGPTDSDTPSEPSSDTPSDSESDSQTVEDETPPELDPLCHLALAPTSASEPAGASTAAKGDGRWPSLAATDDASLVVFAYRDSKAPYDWDIRVAPYSVLDHGTGPTPAALSLTEPVEKGVASQRPAVAATESGYLVVFEDARWDPTCDPGQLSSCRTDLGLVLLDTTGAPISSNTPLRLTSGSGIATWPSIATTDAGALIAWVEAGKDGTGNATVLSLEQGGDPGAVTLLTPEPDADDESRVKLASRGTGALAVFGLSGPARIAARLLAADGAPAGDLLILDEQGGCKEPAVVATASGYLVVWRSQLVDDYEIMARTVSAEGELGETMRLTFTTSDAREPAVAWNGEHALVTWTSDRRSGSVSCSVTSCNAQVQAVLVDENGVALSSEVTLSKDENEQSLPFVAWDGQGWTVLWEARRNLRQEVFYARVACTL